MKRTVKADGAPAAIGPYSQAAAAGGFLFTAGQIALDPQTGEMVDGDAAVQTRRVMDNLTAVLEAAGAGWDRVVKADIFLVDLADFASVNDVYAEYVGAQPPARATVEIGALPRDALVEIAVVAYLGDE